VPVAQLSSVESFIHRDYAGLFATVPAIALGSITSFMLRDRAAARRAGAGAGESTAGMLALAGVVLTLMADRLESDPLGYPQLAGAVGRLVAPADGPEAVPGGRARRAAADVLRPLALATLVRATALQGAAA